MQTPARSTPPASTLPLPRQVFPPYCRLSGKQAGLEPCTSGLPKVAPSPPAYGSRKEMRMNRMLFCIPVLAIAVCQVAVAEPRAGLFRNASLPIAEESAAPVSLVGFLYRGGGGYAPSCG